MSLFDDYEELGIFSEVAEKKSKAEKKTPKKGKGKTAASTTKKAASYKGPFRVVFDSVESVDISAGEYSEKEVFKKVQELSGISLFAEEHFVLLKLTEGIYYMTPKSQRILLKGGETAKKVLYKEIKEISEFLNEEETPEEKTLKTKVEQLALWFLKNAGKEVSFAECGDTLVPLSSVERDNVRVEEVRFPITLSSLIFDENIEISKEEYEEFVGELADSKLTLENLKKLVCAMYPDFPDLMLTMFPQDKENPEEGSRLMVCHKRAILASSKPKEKMYPTDATISLIVTRIPLSPEMFEGKKEITQKEVIRFLEKDYPEYSSERTELQYDEKKKLIIPLLKSGKRGAGEYELWENELYRFESSEIMTVHAEKGELGAGKFIFRLPLIPFSILQDCIHFFWCVYIFQKTEAIAQIFWDRKKRTYEIFIPEQYCTSSYVRFDRDVDMEYAPDKLLVMEIHSHGGYQAFWSHTDDEDEVSHRLYGVVGDLPFFGFDFEHIKVRASTGNYYVVIPATNVFQFPKKVEEFHPYLNRVNKLV